jgi:PLU-1-like protein.
MKRGHKEKEREAELINKIRQELIKGADTKALPSPQKATPEDIKRVQEGLKKLEEELKKTKKWEEVVRRVQEQQREAVERAEEMNRWIRSVFRGLPAFHPLKSALLKRKEELENVIKELKARLPSSEELKDIKNMVNEIKQLEQEIQKLKQLEEELTSLVKGGANKPEKVIKPTKKKKGK